VDGLGAEIASFLQIQGQAGRVLAALWLAGVPQTVRELCQTLGYPKDTRIYPSLCGLEAAGIIYCQTAPGERRARSSWDFRRDDSVVLRAAYVGRVRRSLHRGRTLCENALADLAGAEGRDAEELLWRLGAVMKQLGALDRELPNVLLEEVAWLPSVSEILALRLPDVVAYLRSHGWSESESLSENPLSPWEITVEDKYTYEVLVPRHQHGRDYARDMRSVLEELGVAEGRSPLLIMRDITSRSGRNREQD